MIPVIIVAQTTTVITNMLCEYDVGRKGNGITVIVKLILLIVIGF